jgi:hypothetical protein
VKFDPPLLTEGPLSGAVYVVTHGKVEPHPTREGETMVTASVKYDVTEQFEKLVAHRSRCVACGGKGRRSTWVNELQREVEGYCPDCTDELSEVE